MSTHFYTVFPISLYFVSQVPRMYRVPNIMALKTQSQVIEIQTPYIPSPQYFPKTKLMPIRKIHIEVMDRIIVYRTSLAARNELGSVKAIGQMVDTQTLWYKSSITQMPAASSDKLYSPISRFEKTQRINEIRKIAQYAIFKSFIAYFFACSFSPAPTHLPTTVIIESPMAVPGIYCSDVSEFVTAFAAI